MAIFTKKTVCYLSYSISYVWKFFFFYLLNDIDVMSQNVIWYAKSRCFESIRSTWKLLVIERARKTDKLSLVLPWLSSQECHFTKNKNAKIETNVLHANSLHWKRRWIWQFLHQSLGWTIQEKKKKLFFHFPFKTF